MLHHNFMQCCVQALDTLFVHNYVTGPEKTGLNTLVHIMAFTYLMFWICYSQVVSFIKFLIDFCMHDEI